MRRKAREYVFELIFENSFWGKINEDTLGMMLLDAGLEDGDKEFMKKVSHGVQEHIDELNSIIASHLTGYTLDRVYRPDYCIMLIACYELKYTDTSPKVVINEAVTLAKKYGTENSYKFVNGVLAKVLADI